MFQHTWDRSSLSFQIKEHIYLTRCSTSIFALLLYDLGSDSRLDMEKDQDQREEVPGFTPVPSSQSSTSAEQASIDTIAGSLDFDNSNNVRVSRPILRVLTQKESLQLCHLKQSGLISSASPPHHVTFDTVEIRAYAIILGCNPAVTKGPPMTINWDHCCGVIEPVDEYEAKRLPRKSAILLRKSSLERQSLLKEEGFGSDDFRMAEAAVDEIKNSRELSKQGKSDLSAMIAESKRKKAQQKVKKTGSGFLGFSFFKRNTSRRASSAASA